MGQAALRLRLLPQLRARPDGGGPGRLARSGPRVSSASIHHGCRTEGRVHGIRGAGELAFVIDAAGQLAERLMNWTMLERDDELRAWLPTWKGDGGDAKHFRQALGLRFRDDEFGAWRFSEQTLVPLRLAIRQVARAL